MSTRSPRGTRNRWHETVVARARRVREFMREQCDRRRRLLIVVASTDDDVIAKGNAIGVESISEPSGLLATVNAYRARVEANQRLEQPSGGGRDRIARQCTKCIGQRRCGCWPLARPRLVRDRRHRLFRGRRLDTGLRSDATILRRHASSVPCRWMRRRRRRIAGSRSRDIPGRSRETRLRCGCRRRTLSGQRRFHGVRPCRSPIGVRRQRRRRRRRARPGCGRRLGARALAFTHMAGTRWTRRFKQEPLPVTRRAFGLGELELARLRLGRGSDRWLRHRRRVRRGRALACASIEMCGPARLPRFVDSSRRSRAIGSGGIDIRLSAARRRWFGGSAEGLSWGGRRSAGRRYWCGGIRDLAGFLGRCNVRRVGWRIGGRWCRVARLHQLGLIDRHRRRASCCRC